MKNKNWLYIILGILAVLSCKDQSTYQQKTEEEIWRLGWRIIENSMDYKLEIAESQFDTLLRLTTNIDNKFLVTGLEVKSKLNRIEEIDKILSQQDQNMLSNLCQQEFLRGTTACKDIEEAKPKNELLQIELIKMYINDQYVRSNLMEDLLEKYNLDINEVIIDSFGVDTDELNRNRLKEIINGFGFPNRELVGKDAMNGVFYIIQHSDGDKEWQKTQLINIENAVKNGDMDGQSYAYLYDRIKINSLEKQLYGTQFSNVDPVKKTVTLAPTEDIGNLDARRREVGMMPIEMYKRIMLKNI